MQVQPGCAAELSKGLSHIFMSNVNENAVDCFVMS
jgi:hypothetical protein